MGTTRRYDECRIDATGRPGHALPMHGRVLALPALCAVLALAAGTSVATAGEQDTAAATFAVRTVRLLAANRYAEVWRSLHPSHQRVTGSRARYVRCELLAPFVGNATTVEALSVWDETAAIAGIGRTRTKTVAIAIELSGLGRITHIVHVLYVNGAWRWVFPQERYASYRRGACG
jgi:hypothetical protein